MELCFVKKMCLQDLGVPCAICTTYHITHEALYVVALMCLMYGWPWKYQYRHTGSLVKGSRKICGCICIVGDQFDPILEHWN